MARDFQKIHRIVTEAYRNDGQLDAIEVSELAGEGLDTPQIRLIRDTIFINSPGEVTAEETSGYFAAGLEDLASLLKERRPEPPWGVRYWGISGVGGFARYILHNPLDLEGPFPNDTSTAFGADFALGLGTRSERETSLIRDPLRVEGELHLTWLRGRTSDRISLSALQGVIDGLTEQAERELEREYQSQFGSERDFNLEAPELGELSLKRDAKFDVFLVQWRRLFLEGFKPVPGNLNLFDMYANLGMGVMLTETDVDIFGKDSHASKTSFLGRASLEMDAIRVTTRHFIVALRGGVGITAGSQGGMDALMGLAIFHRLGE